MNSKGFISKSILNVIIIIEIEYCWSFELEYGIKK
jgi:hypothetical protein